MSADISMDIVSWMLSTAKLKCHNHTGLVACAGLDRPLSPVVAGKGKHKNQKQEKISIL